MRAADNALTGKRAYCPTAPAAVVRASRSLNFREGRGFIHALDFLSRKTYPHCRTAHMRRSMRTRGDARANFFAERASCPPAVFCALFSLCF